MNPWRAVKDAYIRTNRKKLGRISGSVTSRTWELTLECGHHVSRYVRVPDGTDPFWKRVADLQDNGKPKKARCSACGFRESSR